MIRFSPPKLRRDFIIIVHRKKQHLCAAAISYLFEPDQYLPVFSFTDVDVPASTPVANPDIYAIQRRRAEHFTVFANNAILHNGGCENLILLGLSKNQISYLDFLDHYNVLTIEKAVDLESFLGGFAFEKDEAMECSPEQSLQALIVAIKNNRKLKVGLHNTILNEYEFGQEEGIVVIEKGNTSDVVIAINYGVSVGAKVQLIDEVEDTEASDVLYLLQEWNDGNLDALSQIEDKLNTRVGSVNFQQFQFATFFTRGLPYSLLVMNIPVSYVHVDYRSDFFIHNAIFYETGKRTGSAVVFSPIFFKGEETDNLIALLEFKNFYLRKLVAKAANVYNLKNTIELYSFDLLHICSHGGDVGGTRCEVRFKDAGGNSHTIEFDHVLTVAITPFLDKHAVESIYYFKKMDGLTWRSKELKALNYSHQLYASLLPEISRAFDQKRVRHLGNVDRVPDANAIHCDSFNYLANFEQLGNVKCPPIIFNNTCFSWMNVSTSFLVAGSRGYIGTLTAVVNDRAVRFAEVFYDNVFEVNVIDAVHAARLNVASDVGETTHIFWGLHFSTLNNHETVKTNQRKTVKYLAETLAQWQIKLRDTEGAPELLKRKMTDTNWLFKSVILSDETGHVPLNFRQDRI